MQLRYLVIPAVALAFGMSMQAQTLEETKAYILRELPQAIPAREGVDAWFKEFPDGAFCLVKEQVNPLDKKTRRWAFFFDDIDVSIAQDRYGTHLIAHQRQGRSPIQMGDPNSPERMFLPSAYIISGSDNPEKVRKLQRAFNHLIELVTGRKELF